MTSLFQETCGAEFSTDRVYRYALWRRWDKGQFAVFIGLNPSIADETKDDQTIRRCIGFARDWGYGGLAMLNLFAFRATKPADMKAAPEPVGPENYYWIVNYAHHAGILVAAWGNDGAHKRQDQVVLDVIDHADQLVHHLGMTKSRQPKHPLYLPKTTKPILWERAWPTASGFNWIISHETRLCLQSS